MLNQIRKAADSIIFRIVMGIIVLAFIFWGIKDLNRAANQELVSFKSVPPITMQQFEMRKHLERTRLQRMSGTVLTDEEFNNSGLAQYVMDKMVTERLLEFAANDYGIEISEKMLTNYIRSMQIFHDEEGFNSRIFSNVVRNSGQTEEDYIKEIKDKLRQNILVNTIMLSYIVPQKLIDNIIAYMAEEREIELGIVDLKKEVKNTNIEPTEDQLKAFYEENSQQFLLSEKRCISYIIISKDSLKSHLNINETDLHNYYEQNKDDFAAIDFKQAKNKISEIMSHDKLEELMANYAKKLEDEVAGGANLREIAEKYKLQIHNKQNITISNIENDDKLQAAQNNIFAMDKNEVSYPFDNGKELLIVEIDDIEEQHVEAFDKIKKEVQEKWLLAELAKIKLKQVQNMLAANNIAKLKEEAQKNGFKFAKYEISRNSRKELPDEMILGIFNLKQNGREAVILETPSYQDDKIYIAILNQVKIDEKKAKQIAKNNKNAINDKVKEGLFIQIIKFFRDQQDVKINNGSVEN